MSYKYPRLSDYKLRLNTSEMSTHTPTIAPDILPTEDDYLELQNTAKVLNNMLIERITVEINVLENRVHEQYLHTLNYRIETLETMVKEQSLLCGVV